MLLVQGHDPQWEYGGCFCEQVKGIVINDDADMLKTFMNDMGVERSALDKKFLWCEQQFIFLSHVMNAKYITCWCDQASNGVITIFC